ncbi:MAG: FG-GAP repeat protein, partial [Phycisphaerales bacterium]
MGRSIRSLRLAGVVGVAALCWIEAASAQTACQEDKVTAFDGGVFQSHGRAVAIWGDTALVGAHWDDDLGTQSGSAYVYQREPGPEGNWVFAQKLLASDGGASEHFGRSVAIEGDTAMVGATAHLHNGQGGNGAVYVFKYDPDTSGWIQQQELVASDGAIGDGFGVSVSISGDVALIGAPSDDDDGFASGSVYVFQFDPKTSQWIEVQKLTASDAMTSDSFGGSVAVAGDLAVIGTPGQDGVA